jgi:hypothetical protein
MAESSERQASWPIIPPRDRSDISEELFGAYKKEYIQERRVIEEETKWNLEWLKKMFWLSKSKPPEKPKEPIYDPLKLSHLGKKFLDANHEKAQNRKSRYHDDSRLPTRNRWQKKRGPSPLHPEVKPRQ